MLQGTLDLLILRRLMYSGLSTVRGIARAIRRRISFDELLNEHGALYPALQRLETRGWISATWGTSENNRRARFYTTLDEGVSRKQLARESTRWRRMAAAIGRVLGHETSEA